MPDDQVVVTGGSKGIGAAIATELAARGHEVVSLSRSGTAPVGRAVACDLTDEAALVAAVAGLLLAGLLAPFSASYGVGYLYFGDSAFFVKRHRFDFVALMHAFLFC